MINRLDKKSQKHLLSLTQVTGLGTGFKEVQGMETDQQAIIVLVEKKLPLDQLNKQDIIPKKINGMPTDVIEVGHLKAFSATQTESSPIRTERTRPAPPGVSIGHYLVSAGTFGALVYDSKHRPLILSNNHILANSSNGHDRRARINDSILQPGAYDAPTSKNSNIIARLTKFVPLNNRGGSNLVDCAVAKPLQNDLVIPEILGIGLVWGTTAPALGTIVKKSGRTTGVTTGKIKAIDVISKVDYGNNRILKFEHQILTTGMSAPGDSGSLVLDDNNLAIGLLFAGSSSSTLLNPIRKILDLLEVSFQTS